MNPAAGLTIRLFDLDALGSALDGAETRMCLLSPDEKAWPPTVRPDVLRRRRAARIALRLVLLDAGAGAARGGPFALEPAGKPYLAGGPAFSLSHSEQLALIAVAPSGPVGVDLERARTTTMEIRRRALIEAAGLALAGPRDSDADRLLAAWTRLEALAKALGVGMGRLLTALGITARRAEHLSAEDAAGSALRIAAEAGLAVAVLPLPPLLFGAIAGRPELIAEGPAVVPLSREDVERLLDRRGGHLANP
jgi:4'-phosphopantetheinyl transferase